MSNRNLGEGSPLRSMTVGAVGVIALAATAGAQITPSDPIITINGVGGSLSGSWSLPLSAAMPISNGWVWGPGMGFSNFDLNDSGGGGTIATITNLSIYMLGLSTGNPQVSLAFSMTNGVSDASFSFTSSVMSFAPMAFPEGVSSAGFTVSDSNGDGVIAGPKLPGGFRYRAMYNGSSTFASFLPGGLVAGGIGSNSETSTPNPLVAPIGTPVSSIQSEFSFSLTAGDQASGTSTFLVRPIPAPGAVVLAGAGLAFGIRRRR